MIRAALLLLLAACVIPGAVPAGPREDREIEKLEEMIKGIAGEPAATPKMEKLRQQELALIRKRLTTLRASQFENDPPPEYREAVDLYREARKCSASVYVDERYSADVRVGERRTVRRGYADAVRKMELAVKAWPDRSIPPGWEETRAFLYEMRARELRNDRDILSHHSWTERMREKEAVRLESFVERYRASRKEE